MTLGSSRINDEFKLIQEILSRAVFGQLVRLYPNLSFVLHRDGTMALYEDTGVCIITRAREAARIILRRYW